MGNVNTILLNTINGLFNLDKNNNYINGQRINKNFDLIVFGGIVQDLVSYAERIPNPGESIRGTSFKTFCGGKGANQAVMAAKLGTKVAMIGYVGDDIFADNNISSLAKNGVDVSLIKKLENMATGVASINVTSDGENSIIVNLGANAFLGGKRAKELESVICNARMFLCQQEISKDGNYEALKMASENGVITFFNSAPGDVNMNPELLGFCDIICANENETEFLTNRQMLNNEDIEDCARIIIEKGPKIVIITLGPKGALVAQKYEEDIEPSMCWIKAPKVTAVDTTGAGDCFCGSLAHFLLEIGFDKNQKNIYSKVNESVQKAVEIAAISVQRQGAQASYPDSSELYEKGILKLIF
ncbi:Ribokinase [Meloidogyne graminicola]|uniref:Ribokinase n=1 Tax=Meloidogyne graminicola TaxID=189291 RepID=A0A8S9ZJH5_9BILA|nr:Ribokinase [Meloidogyne graminicola]